jgi:membrane-associated phospholipid phosphatase
MRPDALGHATRTACRPPRVPGLRPGPLLGQVLVVLGAAAAYSAVRGLGGSDAGTAIAHAQRLLDLERALGIAGELSLQRSVLHHDVLLDVLTSLYIWAHLPVIAAVLVWLLRSRPAAFVVLRNAVMVSCALALVVYVLYPVAPPRLAGLGFYDAVADRSSAYHLLQPPGFVNQYAALPSMHVGWSLLMGISLVRYAPVVPLRVVGGLLPLAMATSVVLTANHFFLDVLAGGLVALTGLAIASAWSARQPSVIALPRQRPPVAGS